MEDSRPSTLLFVSMKSLLIIPRESRLVELASSDKVTSLAFLSKLIEAAPNILPEDVFRMVGEREVQANIALGHAVVRPYARVKQGNGVLLYTARWSPTGVDCRAVDSIPMHLVCMYYAPSSERGTFLREMSTLSHARGLRGSPT